MTRIDKRVMIVKIKGFKKHNKLNHAKEFKNYNCFLAKKLVIEDYKISFFEIKNYINYFAK